MDQTQFIENQESLLPPPEETGPLPEVEPTKKTSSNRRKLMLALGGVAVVFGLAGVLVLTKNSGIFPNGQEPVIVPGFSSPTPTPQIQSDYGQRFEGLKTRIQNANPRQLEVVPPQLNLKLTL